MKEMAVMDTGVGIKDVDPDTGLYNDKKPAKIVFGRRQKVSGMRAVTRTKFEECYCK